MFLGERGELVLSERERFRDVLGPDQLDQMLLEEVEVQGWIEVEDLFERQSRSANAARCA